MMGDDASEKPVAGISYYQVLTGLPPTAPKPRHEEKKVEQVSKKPSDDLPPSSLNSTSIQRNRNTLPKARQKSGPRPDETYSNDPLSRTVSGENIESQTYYSRGRGGQTSYQNRRNSQRLPVKHITKIPRLQRKSTKWIIWIFTKEFQGWKTRIWR